MRSTRVITLFRVAGFGAAVAAVLCVTQVHARSFGDEPAAGAQLAELSSSDAAPKHKKRGVCSIKSLRGVYPQRGSIELFSAVRCIEKLSSDNSGRGADDEIKTHGLKMGVHVSRDKLMFTIGAKW